MNSWTQHFCDILNDQNYLSLQPNTAGYNNIEYDHAYIFPEFKSDLENPIHIFAHPLTANTS